MTTKESKGLQVQHNQCDLCLKQFRTALGFHRHYPKCLEENKNNLKNIIQITPDGDDHRHSVLVGKKCAYCMDCGKILLEYKHKGDFYKWLHAFEALATQ